MNQGNHDDDADDQPRFQSPAAVICMLLIWLAFAAGTCGILIWGAL